MTVSQIPEPTDYVASIRRSGLTIYDSIEVGDPHLWIPASELEALLDTGLHGLALSRLALRTRSKVVKQEVCRVLGYPVPTTFKKAQPRFPGQRFDTYVQKANNLQVWNEELSPTRRYVLIRTGSDDAVNRVKVVTGDTIALLDTTGTLTKKYQARYTPGTNPAELTTNSDTQLLSSFVGANPNLQSGATPIMHPQAGAILTIDAIFQRLSTLVGRTFVDAGMDQERNRGAGLHRLVCHALGYAGYQDDGQFPDIRHQLVEVKLQTAATIDRGLVLPSSEAPLDLPMIAGQQLRHCDVRYAVFSGRIDNGEVELTHLVLTTGEAFFTRFQQFQGKVLNAKLQIHLPGDFFDR